MRLLLLALLGLATACASAQPADPAAAELAGIDAATFYDGWDDAAGRILREHHDADGSGALDADEVAGIGCAVWELTAERYAAEYGQRDFWIGMGLAPGLMWNGDGLGIADGARAALWARLTDCVPEATAPDAQIVDKPDDVPGSGERDEP